MDLKTSRHLLIFLLVSSIKAENLTSNDSLSEELRQPRASGRIVKLYSGTKPEPILCAGEGFQADPNDCAIFYRCIKSGNGKYSVFRFRCGPGTVYDPNTEVCNHPRNTKRSECGGLKGSSADISNNDVNEIEEVLQELPAPISTKLPVYTERTTTTASFAVAQKSSEKPSFTDYISPGPTIAALSTKHQASSSVPNLTTVPMALIQTSSVSTAYPWATTTNRVNTHYASTSELELMSSGTNQMSSNNMICTFDGFIGDSENCHKFYRCVRNQKGGYTKFQFSCSESTIWDDDIQACNHPWAVKRSRCGRSSAHNKNSSIPNALDIAIGTTPQTNPNYERNKTIQHQVQISYDSNVSQNQVQISKGPAIQNQTQINYGDQLNKTKYSTIKQNQVQISYGSAVSQMQTQINNENEVVKPQSQIDHVKEISQTQMQIQESTNNTAINNGSNMCTQSGFIRDPNDCKKFYRCVNNGRGSYTRHEFSCGEGTVWDSKTEACNHAWLVKECGHKVLSSPVTSEVLSTSNIKSTENYDIMTTKTSHNYYTTSEIIPTKAFEDAGYGSGNQDTTISAIITLNTTTSDTTKSEENICKSNGFIGDTKDCKIFYKCVENDKGGYTKHEFKCGEGTVWDPDINACNHAWEVKKCGGSAPIDSEKVEIATTSSTSKTNFSSAYTTQSNIQLTQQTVMTNEDTGYGSHKDEFSSTTIKTTKHPQYQGDHEPNKCKTSGFMSDGQNCKKFYRCVDNGSGSYTKYEFTCGEGTVWDAELEGCNYEWAIKECGSMNTSTSVTQANVITSTIISTEHYIPTSTKTTIYYNTTLETVPNTTTSQSTAIETTTQILLLQENECQSSGFIGDTKDCKKFYRCVKNGEGGYTKYQFECGEGTVWDPDIEACNHVWAVKKCGGIPSINNEIIETTTIHSALTTNSNSQSSEQTDQHDDYDTGYNANEDNFSPTTLKTTKQPQDHDNSVSNECHSSGFMGDRQDCKKFYRCVDSGSGSYTRYEFTCGEGTVWDPKIQACNHEWAVKDCSISGPAPTSDETSHQNHTTAHEEIGVSYSTQSEINTVTSTIISLTSSTTIKTTISNDGNKCSSSGFIGDSKDCKKFYRCVDNGDGSHTRHEFLCGEGTVWDQSIEACNHAWAVKKCGHISETTEHIPTSQTSPILDDEEIANGYPLQDDDSVGQTTQNKTVSSTTEMSPNLLNEHYNCKVSGFFGDRTNCKQFYRCVDDGKGGFIQHEFQCGEGTVWDQSIEACNHAGVVKTCGSGNDATPNQTKPTTLSDSTLFTEKTTMSSENYPVNELAASCKQTGFFEVKKDCKKFYRCVDNGEGGFIKHEFKCGEGTYWNQNITACDHVPPDQPCGENESTTKEYVHENDEMLIETTAKTTTLSAVTVGSEETSLIDSSQSICESEGFHGDSNDCKFFYRCVDNGKGSYTKYDFTCGDGTMWNQEIQACDHISSNNKCIPVYSSTEINGSQQDKENYTTAFTTIAQEQQSTEKIVTVTSSSNNRCESEGFHADSSDCKKFIRCVSNPNGGYTKYEFTCGEGTIWVQDIQACDYDNGLESCSSQYNFTIKPQPTESQPSFTTSDIISPASTAQTQTPPKEDDEYDNDTSKEPGLSSAECSSEGFYAHHNDCKRFYRCVANNHGGYTKYDFSCGEGSAWDGDIQACNHISQVITCKNPDSQDSQIQPIVHDETISQTTENASTSKSSTISDTNENTSTTKLSTLSETNEENTSTTKSTTLSVPHENTSTTEDACEKEGYYGNMKNCKLFYRCVDDGKGGFTKYDYSCGDGTIWDQDITACNHPQDVVNPSCNMEQEDTSTSPTSSSSSTISSTPNSEISQSTTSTTENSGPTSQNCTQDQSSNKPENKNITCNKAGYYAHPNDCKKFYRCVDWDGDGKRFSVYYFDCGEGTIWDPTVETCNHEESVYPPRDCSGAQSQNENVESTTTTETVTTLQSTTSEETAGQQPATEQTTSSQSTISEQTTAQQSTSTELSTTQQSSTSEQTTQQTITSDQTTQQSSTSTQSTTQQSTSTEKTTTHQSSTSEQTTTQQSTSSELTTTQQTSTSEQTTTQTSTSSEQTSVKPSNSSDQTTTEQTTQSTESSTGTTTEEPITTGSSTVIEETTTESHTTSQQTTTDHASTNNSSNTEVSTTEDSTTTTTQSSDTTSTTENQQETPTNATSNSECPDTDDDQNLFVCPTSFRRHPKYCNLFYQCTVEDDSHEPKIAVFTCPNDTIYDESKIQCVEENKADKPCKGETATKRRFKRVGANFKEPIVVTRESQRCPGIGHMPFEKSSECSTAFLKCEKTKSGKLRGLVYQCPLGYIYWSISRRCERIDNVRNCRRSTNNWNNRWEIPFERNNVAVITLVLQK